MAAFIHGGESTDVEVGVSYHAATGKLAIVGRDGHGVAVALELGNAEALGLGRQLLSHATLPRQIADLANPKNRLNG